MVSFNTQRCDSVNTDIYVARINPDGMVIDTNGFAVCMEGHDQTRSKIAYGNGGFLVIWQDQRDFDSTGYEIYETRVTSDGMSADSSGKRITHNKYGDVNPNIAGGGLSFLAIWEAENPGQFWDVSGMRQDTLGEFLDSNALVISTACEAQLSASLGWSGSSYLAIWEDNQDIIGVRVDRFGNILDSAAIPICSAPEEQKAPALVWGGGNFFAVWEDFRHHNFDIYGARIDSNGAVLDIPGLPILVDSNFDQRYPEIAFSEGNYLAVWQKMLDSTGSTYQIEGVRVSSAGEIIDPEPLSISSGDKGSYPDVAFAGGKYLVVWLDANFYDIYGALVDTNGTVSSPLGIRIANGIQQNPVVASDGNGFLVVWVDFGTNWPDANIRAARITSSGQVLDPGGFEVATTTDPEQLPSVTFDGNVYVVAWNRITSESGALYLSRITLAGMVLDPDGICISSISPYSGTSISSGPLCDGEPPLLGQSLLLYLKYQSAPYYSLRLMGAFFWGEPEPNLPPEPFSLLLPADNDTVTKPVFLDWEDASDPNPSDQVTYTLYLSPSQQFAPESTLTFNSLNLSQYFISPQKDSTIYWWKVKAQDKWQESRWSNETFKFDLENYGDVNGDGKIDVGDVIFLINYLYKGGSAPQPLASGDANGDCNVDVGDVVYLINYLFKGGSKPARGCA